MKLSELTPEQKTRLLAKLDGKEYCPMDMGVDEDNECRRCHKKYHSKIHKQPNYNSYDAIIPLVQKLDARTRQTICLMLSNGKVCLLDATPSQLCDAVLVATGKAEV